VQLHEKYGKDGFVILAITNEATSAVDNYEKSSGTTLPYRIGFDTGGSISAMYGVKGIPHSLLIDARGQVVSDSGMSAAEGQMEELLKDVKLYELPADLPRSLARVEKAFQARKYGDCLKAARKVQEKQDEDAEAAGAVVAVLEQIGNDLLADVDYFQEKGDFVRIQETLDKLDAWFKGTDLADDSEAKRKALEEASEDDMKAAALYLRMEAMVDARKKDKDKAKLAPNFIAIAEKYRDTKVAEQARRRAKQLKDLDD